MAVAAQDWSLQQLEPQGAVASTMPRRIESRPLLLAGLAAIGLLVGAVAAVTAIAGRAGGNATGGSGTSTPSPDVRVLERQYTQLADTYAAAAGAWRSQLQGVTVITVASAERLIRPAVAFADTVDQVDKDVGNLQWPSSLRQDVEVLRADLAAVSGDLRSIGGQSVSSMPQWISMVLSDWSRSSAASDRLVQDLGTTSSQSTVS